MELNVCPGTLRIGFSDYSAVARKSLFDGRKVSCFLDFDGPSNDSMGDGLDYESQVGRVSLSGVQPKSSLVVGEDNRLRKPASGQSGTFILKPAPASYALFERRHCPANEHLTMQLASQVYAIETAANGVCFFRNGEVAYLCRRFDVAPDGSKFQMEDLASIAGLTKANGGSDYKYCNLSYEECAALIGSYVSSALVEVLKFFRIVVFNYLTLNDDAHLKNFSLISNVRGEYRLAPAYDLINTSLHLRQSRIFALDKGLFKEGMSFSDVKSVGRGDFEEFGRRIGLASRIVKRELDFLSGDYSLARELIDNSFLSPELKSIYWCSYKYRRGTIL